MLEGTSVQQRGCLLQTSLLLVCGCLFQVFPFGLVCGAALAGAIDGSYGGFCASEQIDKTCPI